VVVDAASETGRTGETDDTGDLDRLLIEALATPEGRADPYPRYAAVRERVPAYRTALGNVMVGRYEDCQSILRDPRFGKGTPRPWEQHGLTEDEWHQRFPAFARNRRGLLYLDPPDHTRVRRLVAKAFTPRTVERLRPEIVRLTDRILDGFAARSDGDGDGAAGGVVDVIAELALRLPITVIGEMLGVPEDERMDLQPLVRAGTASLDLGAPLDQLDVAFTARGEVIARLEALIVERREHPTDDLLSQLIHVEEQGDQLSYDELTATLALLFAAGFETTTNLIGNGLLALLDHPDQMARLRADRSLVRPAVEEMLRWDSPVQLDSRKALEDLDLHGVPIRAGDTVVLLIGAANRDPRAFPDPDPDRFDVGRDGAPPMSFGAGIHHCIGAALARAEGQVVFDRLLDRFPVIEPAWPAGERPAHLDSPVLRGLRSLPVRFVGHSSPATCRGRPTVG
jgi:cytochrome P450